MEMEMDTTTGMDFQPVPLSTLILAIPQNSVEKKELQDSYKWFEGIENTFINSECPNNFKVRYAISVLHKRALTWWNEEKRTRGAEAALALTWDQAKDIMKAEFCPRNEIKKLEDEFHDLAQDSGENLAYNTRFHELSLLLPHKVTPLPIAIEKYIGGLPMQIQDT